MLAFGLPPKELNSTTTRMLHWHPMFQNIRSRRNEILHVTEDIVSQKFCANFKHKIRDLVIASMPQEKNNLTRTKAIKFNP